MIKKTIKYTDYNGTEREDTYYFNLNDAEIAELQAEFPEGLDNIIKKAVESNDAAMNFRLVKLFISRAIGYPSEDGRFFRKNDQFAVDFFQSEAYSELIYEIGNNQEAAEAFFKGLVGAKHINN